MEDNFLRTTHNTVCKSFILIFTLMAILFGNTVSAAAEPIQVAVVPFKIYAEKDLTFLKDGIVDMLSSRLSWEDKVAVVGREKTDAAFEAVTGPLNANKARTIGDTLGADYVLFGSLTIFGNSVSIDAKMVDVSNQSPPLAFFSQSKGMDDVISKIDLFASDINEKVFGRVMPSQRVAAVPPAPAPQAQTPQAQAPQAQIPQAQSSTRAHPEKMIAGGLGSDELKASQGAGLGGAFAQTQKGQEQSNQIWKSRNIKQRINGIAIGDVDQDGKLETIMISNRTVEVYRFEQQRFYKVATAAKRKLDHFIGVDVADINGNGYPEIFVTSLDPYKNYANSFVVEFNGQEYKEIVTDSRWYFRVVKHPNRGRLLLGQRLTAGGPISGEISEMVWQNSEYEPADPVMRSWRASVMGFAFGDVINDGTEVAVTFDQNDYFQILGMTGKKKWRGREHSGGSPLYLVMEDPTSDIRDVKYFSVRVDIRDINGNGNNEVITVRNHKLSDYLSYRDYRQGEVQIHRWDGIGLALLRQTAKLDGYFSDFAIGDFDNDGQDEIVTALVIKTGSIVTTKPKSAVVAYELQ